MNWAGRKLIQEMSQARKRCCAGVERTYRRSVRRLRKRGHHTEGLHDGSNRYKNEKAISRHEKRNSFTEQRKRVVNVHKKRRTSGDSGWGKANKRSDSPLPKRKTVQKKDKKGREFAPVRGRQLEARKHREVAAQVVRILRGGEKMNNPRKSQRMNKQARILAE